MKKILILALVILNAKFILATENNPFTIDTTNQVKIQPEQSVEDQPLEKLLEDLKKRSIEKNIEIYYLEKTIKETIIQEAPKEEYLEHLLWALKDSLKKGKKTGKIRRAEKNLVEIDKGAIHKVRERDIYKVYDSTTGAYKGKVEIQAIADAVSIGKNYNLRESSININDTVKFLGNRKYMEIGLNGSAYLLVGNGLVFRYTVFSGWGFEIIFGGFGEGRYRSLQGPPRLREIFSLHFDFPIGIRKYFCFPSLISPYLGSGIFYFNGSYSNELNHVFLKDEGLFFYFSTGLQFFSNRTIHIDIEIRYFHGPDWPMETKSRPTILLISFCNAW